MISDNGNGKIRPEEAKELLHEYANFLPGEMGAKLLRYNESLISRHFKGDGSDDFLEVLLPTLRVIPSKEILAKMFPPLPWVVPDYLPPGLAFLYGRPKLGKSWLGLQLALSVLCGGKMFDKDIEAGGVLYLALEDSERRLKDRMVKQSWPAASMGVDFMLFDAFRDQIGSLNDAGGKRLLAYVESQKYRLVIVDTFSRAMQGDQLKADEMTAAIAPIQMSALARDIAVVIIDHEPKNGDSLFGSVAKFGVLDTSWRLYREQGKRGARLDITGRDVDEHALKLVFDRAGCYWNCEGEASEVDKTERRKEILEVLESFGRCQVGDISETTGQAKPHVHTRLQDLVNSGLVSRIVIGSNVFYELTEKE